MGIPDLLSQEEIDVLLNSVEDGDYATETVINEFLEADGAKVYDFSSRERVVRRGQIQTLEMINDRFSIALRASLFQLLQRVPQLSASGIQLQKFSDFMGGQRAPSNLNIVRITPLRGRALIVMDSRLVFTIVDNYFGGNGQFDHHSQDREFTRAEIRVIRKILDRVFKDLKDAWEPVLAIDFDYLKSEINPAYAAIAGADDYVITSAFNIALKGNGGELTILMPYAMIEPISGLLDAFGDDGAESDPQWRTALRNQVVEAKVNVNSLLAAKSLSVNDVLHLKKGDIIPIDMPKILSLQAEGVPLFTGKACTSEGHFAVQIIEKL
ncbi:flagellar motor switch protein FliM [Methylomicrobium sp. Wu6]|uniref:flagellar motor switch protein FliM n=1 Tax=Methylomicrobium sp. Wu6 TaxID=3107928 RepID=UPI002DD6420F|nr:flagellar motor switch protein FliM [Methylomicrobium sp. Wu6]MEC4747969.1 flagellar motor switch protein FliM [Methylomicrobium sp. Wu6]